MIGTETGKRSEAERETLETEAPYRALFEAMDSAVLLMRGPACVSCNPASVRLFGLRRPEDLIGKTPLDFAPPYQPNGMSSAKMVEDNFIQANARGTYAFEWLTTKADGQQIIIEVRFTMLNGVGDLYLCTAVDISERKRAERALSESEARFRTIFERAVEGILVADAEGRRLRFANPAICQLLGYEHDELISLGVADIHPPGTWPEVVAAFERHLRGEKADLETVCKRKDGTLVPVSICSAPLELAGGKHIVGFFTDITSRRQLDEERLKAQKLEAVGRLAGGIAHDFNNLLQGVFGYISLARLAQDNEEERLAMLKQAEKALRQSVHLTTQLLTFSKGGKPLKQTINIGPLLRSVASFALSGARADCRFAISDDLRAVDADEGQIEQVIHNIVLNAAQAMPFGGIVHVEASNVASPCRGLPPQLPGGRFVAVSIRDTGAGIPPEFISKIFDPYFTTKDKGTGLGLATSYAIVNNHRGLIHVQSAVGEGSTFTVYLPVADAAAADAQEAERRELDKTKCARLLVMDDDPVVLDVTAKLLRNLGHRVDIAEHGEVALDLYRKALAGGARYDLVILDLTVRGGIGGLETAKLLREVDSDVRVVVSSGYSDEMASLEQGKEGVMAFLKKPFDLDELSAIITPLLG